MSGTHRADLNGPGCFYSTLGPAGFVGIDPEGLRGLADVAGQYAQRLALAVANINPHLHRVPAVRETLARDLGFVQRSLDDDCIKLRWRADVIAAAESMGVFTTSPLPLQGWLAEFAAVGLLSLPTRREDFAAWVAVRWLQRLRLCEPEQVAAAFAAMGAERMRQLAIDFPHLVGGLDGAPPTLRYAANRILIAAEIERLEAAAAKLEPQAAAPSPTGVALRLLREKSSEYRRWLDEGRLILLFDPNGDGRVIEVFGDLGAASAVAVLVPGMANDIDNFSTPAGGFRSDARELFRAADPATATIAWLGYDTPDGVDAAGRGAAEAAAPLLARFVSGVDPNGDRTVTVFAHSYGSVVAGMAARSGLDADNLVFLGSPGTTLQSAGEAALRGDGRVWAALAARDPIGLGIDPGASHRWWHIVHPVLPVLAVSSSLLKRDELWHGPNPVDDGFGANRIDTSGSSGHSEYYEASTVINLAAILNGRYDDVVRSD